MDPQRLGARAVGIGRRQPVVQWHVEGHRHHKAPDQVEGTPGEQPLRDGCTSHGNNRDRKAHCARSKERQEEPRVEYRDVDGLHGSDPLVLRQLTEGSHDERGKGEEDSRNQAGAQHRNEGQGVHELPTIGSPGLAAVRIRLHFQNLPELTSIDSERQLVNAGSDPGTVPSSPAASTAPATPTPAAATLSPTAPATLRRRALCFGPVPAEIPDHPVQPGEVTVLAHGRRRMIPA